MIYVIRSKGMLYAIQFLYAWYTERRLMEKMPKIVVVEPIANEESGLELNEENIEKVVFHFQ